MFCIPVRVKTVPDHSKGVSVICRLGKGVSCSIACIRIEAKLKIRCWMKRMADWRKSLEVRPELVWSLS